MKPNQDQALEDFCRANFRALVGMLSLWGNDAYVAQELAQEIMARVCRDWGRVRRMDHPEAWARRIALTVSIIVLFRSFSDSVRMRLTLCAVKLSDP